MKKIYLVICLLISGCCSQRFEYFTTRFNLPTAETRVTPYISVSHKNIGIPFIAWREKRGAPYSLELNFRAINKPTNDVRLIKVTLTDTEGAEHVLLNGSGEEINDFKIRKYHASHATLGSYHGDVYEAVRVIKNIPLEFSKNSGCTVGIEYTVGDQTFTEKWDFASSLEKKTQNVIDYAKSF